MSDSVHVRNALALAEGAKLDRVRHDALVVRTQHLENQVTMLRTELTDMRQQVVMLIASRGTGPTARS